MEFINGKKTYIAGFTLLAWAIYAGTTGIIDGATAVELILMASAILGLRHAVAKVGK
jgi:hypothetical protein